MPPLSDTIGGLRFAAIDFESAGAARGETDQILVYQLKNDSC